MSRYGGYEERPPATAAWAGSSQSSPAAQLALANWHRQQASGVPPPMSAAAAWANSRQASPSAPSFNAGYMRCPMLPSAAVGTAGVNSREWSPHASSFCAGDMPWAMHPATMMQSPVAAAASAAGANSRGWSPSAPSCHAGAAPSAAGGMYQGYSSVSQPVPCSLPADMLLGNNSILYPRPDTALDSQWQTTLCARWQLVGELGRGHHSVVFEAQIDSNAHTAPHCRRMAVKVLLPSKRRLDGVHHTEEDVLKRLRYQAGFVQYIGSGSVFIQPEGPTWPCQFLQLYDCSLTMGISIGRIGYSAEEQLRQIARQLVEGVDRMHSLGVISRNIKPSNFLLGADGALYFADFDLAELCDPGTAQAKTMWQPVGTYLYMSPDMLTGGVYSCCVDQWSVGATLLDVASGLQLGQLCENSLRGQRRVKDYLDQFVHGNTKCCQGKLAAQLTDPSTRCLADMRDFVAACCGLGPYVKSPQAVWQLRQHRWLQG